jgi:hypothetical protein
VLLAGIRTSPASLRIASSRIFLAPQCGLSRLLDDQALKLLGQLVGVAHWPPRAVAKRV